MIHAPPGLGALARIDEIRARFGADRPAAPSPSPALGAGATAGPAPTATAFAAVLDRHQPARTASARTASARPTSSTSSSPGESAYTALFQQAGARHGIDPALLSAVAAVESGYDPEARSPAGAEGLMQFMPGTSAGMGVDPWDPASAVEGAARLLRSHLDRFGTVELALAAYNAGPGAVERHGGIPPYAETQAYVAKVLARTSGARP